MNQNDIIAAWPTDAAGRLRLILDVYASSDDDRVVLAATFDPREGKEIGLTLGDLRALATRVGA